MPDRGCCINGCIRWLTSLPIHHRSKENFLQGLLGSLGQSPDLASLIKLRRGWRMGGFSQNDIDEPGLFC